MEIFKMKVKYGCLELSIYDMKDGDIGVIVEWFGSRIRNEVGLVVQRYGNILVVLGKGSGSSYPSILKEKKDGFLVNILRSNDCLILD